MKLWIDDVRPAPEGYVWCRSVNEAKQYISDKEHNALIYDNEVTYYSRKGNSEEAFRFARLCDICTIELIDIDHDAGEYASDGGHYIKLLEWLEETGRNYPIHIHSDNQINLLWMREIIKRNGWVEV